MYPDEIAARLPDIDHRHVLAKEWQIRKKSAQNLKTHLKEKKCKRILEVGCGNGWLINYLHSHLEADCCGVDVNETELRQAVGLFGRHETLCFLCANIQSQFFEKCSIDVVVLASSVQYFQNLTELIVTLQKTLTEDGEIHILDSPFYTKRSLAVAKKKSEEYFSASNVPEMKDYYFHHQWSDLNRFHFIENYNPSSPWNIITRKLWDVNSPFPWLIVRK